MNEDRRQFENLLLMCHDHHVVTDDVNKYPIERMRQIKAEHEARFIRGLASMESSAGINITNSTVSLGGEGGKAPGAGGGGGGAIGPNAIGGNGGEGGEISHGMLRLDDDVVGLRFHVGRGGQGGSDNEPARDGEDTVVEVVRQDGSVQEVMRAKGGKAGDDRLGSARVDICMLANSVEIRDGLIFALAAGWKKYVIDGALPALIEFGVYFIAEPISHQHAELSTNILDPKGMLVAMAAHTCVFTEGSVPVATKARVQVNEAGSWSVVIKNGEQELRRVSF
jgi:hypothetical protein